MTDGGSLSIAVAVLTFRRPTDLAEVLPLLLDQIERVTKHEPVLRARLLVVDNDVIDGVGGARSVVEPHAGALQYELEPAPGIAAARNRALDSALAAGDDLLVFIDDDERPTGDWLTELVRCGRATQAAAVCGPVRSHLPTATDPWIVAGEFFARRHRAGFETGRELSSAATNNLLLDLRAVGRMGLRFDSAFGTSGGEDELFSRRLRDGGGRIVWCAEAVVDEVVRPDRLNRRWLLLRAFSFGAVDARIALTLAGSPVRRARARLLSVGEGVPRIVAGSARWAYGRAAKSLRHDAFGLQTLLRGCGLLCGALGFGVDRYRRASSTGSTAAGAGAGREPRGRVPR